MSSISVEQSIDQFRDRFVRITQEVGRRIVGHDEVVNLTVTSLLAGGHVLLEGIPGVGKTSLVHTLADVLHLKFSRIQFTPDLMPADIVGTNIVQEQPHGGTFFEFQPGPIFANVVLADEINRATPKTQSALLEAMQDVSVSVGSTTYRLEQPFLVLATQNPLEMEGTYPLPEAQLDRFFFKLKVHVPDRGGDARDPRSHHARRRMPTVIAGGGRRGDSGDAPGRASGADRAAGAGLRDPADAGNASRPRRTPRRW